MIVRISRGRGERYDDFDVNITAEMTVLDLLFHIIENIDQTLAFRYSCRGAVCGSCALLANHVPLLACRTTLAKILNPGGSPRVSLPSGAEIPAGGILLEPIPRLPVIRDLVVDWEPFFEQYLKLEPALKEEKNLPDKEHLIGKDEVRELERYTNCILCALCWSACPVVGEVEGYPGPAALAKLYRFFLDSREPGRAERMLLADTDSGWWACDFYTNCRKVCPRGVPPNIAIGKARKHLKGEDQE